MPTANLIIEGMIDEAVGREILTHANFQVGIVRGRKGKGWIDSNLRAINSACGHAKYLVLRDFDGDARCPGQLVTNLIPVRAQGLMLRIANYSIESWVLADATAVARWLDVPETRIPSNTDSLESPKEFLMGLGSRSTRRHRKPLFYDEGDYNGRVLEFVRRRWSVQRAFDSGRSVSLRRAVERLRMSRA